MAKRALKSKLTDTTKPKGKLVNTLSTIKPSTSKGVSSGTLRSANGFKNSDPRAAQPTAKKKKSLPKDYGRTVGKGVKMDPADRYIQKLKKGK